MEPYPVGTKVTYHGSHSWREGEEYVITAHEDNRLGVPVDEFPEYTDGVCYTLFPEGVDHTRFGNRNEGMYFVRRASITPVETAE